jgi:hypothetical protein
MTTKLHTNLTGYFYVDQEEDFYPLLQHDLVCRPTLGSWRLDFGVLVSLALTISGWF